MLYVINITNNMYDKSYTLFETNTDTKFSCTERYLKQILTEQQIEVKNARLVDDQIQLRKYTHEIHNLTAPSRKGTKYIVLCKVNEIEHKLVDHKGRVWYSNDKQINDYILTGDIRNYTFKNGVTVFEDAYNGIEDPEFSDSIAEKYEQHVALTAMLGCKTTFEYEIEGEGKAVRLRMGNAESKRIIIPNFITAINAEAFMHRELESVILGNGLEYIGSNAFESCNISELVIHEKIKFIGQSAFIGNKKLVSRNGEYKENLVILGKSTIILDKRIRE